MHAAHHYDRRVGLGGLLRQGQRVADEVGNLLYLLALVIVGHYERAFLFLEPQDFILESLSRGFHFVYSGLE